MATSNAYIYSDVVMTTAPCEVVEDADQSGVKWS